MRSIFVALVLSCCSLSQSTLEVFQASPPPRSTLDAPACRHVLFEHDFGNSYGAPYVGPYTPPEGCNFTTTIFNLSVVSSGRQFDRLATLWLGDIEVWRTSTAMPTQSGIHWSFQKDMTIWYTLLTQSQKLIFDLGNLIDGDRYTGHFNVTMEALYYDDRYISGFHPAEHIYPISTSSSSTNATSLFSLPDDSGVVNLTLPRNVKHAVVSVTASGNGEEEFWFTNVPSEYVHTFPSNDGWLYEYSPFREVQVLIDGRLAGVSWPFPILFTGGVDPGAWRPIVGIDAFELSPFEVDITPWLGLLTDGQPHTFQLRVVGFDTSAEDGIGPIGENWWVSGSVFVWLDEATEQKTSNNFRIETTPPSFDFHPVVGIEVSNNGTISNTSFHFALTASRNITISSTITTGTDTRDVVWTQSLSFYNIQNMSDLAFNQSLSMITSGSYSDSISNVISHYVYPLNLFSAYDVASSGATTNPGSVFCMVDRSKLTDGISTLPFFTGISVGSESLHTRQNVTSNYHWNRTIVEGTEGLDAMDGEVWLSYSGIAASGDSVVAYHRYAKEKNDSILVDEQGWGPLQVPSTMPLPLPDD
ncbi:uncharacterized protein GGS22DRAFT_46922 [Annulohypoxylon maeteangense]|uniref:uncharacterized protein n=1 Tax=Annulohypoxylon maeteangense TaxID=1927788 RepID=UPI002007530D|nr:uncharacterized protein GGS22DRAFT_46922 [Annulohypoxylon maeteangense]KAI0882610.1 hypothetical protein GGS22DRAFT_46922 [Annulohypoxylon maeteangense]